ncbi:MAG: hypothetical protein HGA78_11270, partial [Nitrospirales bacterium]|nr:hypothetical protein [Nitrospirales bacterium]
MKTLPFRDRLILCFFLSFLAIPFAASAFDVKGLQPVSPYGVFSTFSAESLSRHDVAIGLGFERSV